MRSAGCLSTVCRKDTRSRSRESGPCNRSVIDSQNAAPACGASSSKASRSDPAVPSQGALDSKVGFESGLECDGFLGRVTSGDSVPTRWRSMALSALAQYALRIKARCPGLRRTKYLAGRRLRMSFCKCPPKLFLGSRAFWASACEWRSQILTMSPCEGSNGFSPCRLLISSAKGSRPRASPWVKTTRGFEGARERNHFKSSLCPAWALNPFKV